MEGLTRNRKAKAGSADFPRVGLVHAVETVYKVSEGLGLSEAGTRKLTRFARSAHTQSLTIGKVKMRGLSDGKRNAIIELCHLLRDTDEKQIWKMVDGLKK